MLTFADRVAYQRVIEEVYWRHRIWPKERPDPKPSLDEVMAPAQLGKKVENYLRNSEALEDYWQKPLNAEQLQAEMERMAQHTRQPEVLRELFEALGNDPFVIAECLARPALSERLLTNFYAHDQRFHGDLKRHAETDLQRHGSLGQMKQLSGKYSEIELVKSDGDQDEVHCHAGSARGTPPAHRGGKARGGGEGENRAGVVLAVRRNQSNSSGRSREVVPAGHHLRKVEAGFRSFRGTQGGGNQACGHR